jgi:ParB-like chromosome segregation protein Spo0J
MELEIRLDQIRPGRYQPRQQYDAEALLGLAQSIQAHGLIDRVTVFVNEQGHYELLAGERRWRAHLALALANRGELRLELDEAVRLVCERDPLELLEQHFFLAGYTIPADKKSAEEAAVLAEMAIVSNTQREDLAAMEECQAYWALKDQFGYSVRKIGERVGKSKSYVQDRMNLRNLAPEVAALATPSGGSGPALDLTLARTLASKVPQEMQSAVVDYLQQRQANAPLGEETTRKGQAAISRITGWLDPARWELPEDRAGSPEVRNRARLMRTLIDSIKGGKLGEALVKLDQPLHSWDTSGLLGKKPLDLLQHHDFWAAIEAMTGHTQWKTIPQVTAAGWTCGNCLLQHLHTLIGERAESLDRTAPCKRLAVGNPEEISTCEGFIGPDDPPVIEVPSDVRLHLDETNGRGELKKVGGGEWSALYYVEEPLVYQALYSAARQARERMVQEKAEKTEAGYQARMQVYWQAQQERELALDHFQAHACLKCGCFTGSEGRFACRLLKEPLRRPYGDKEARAPEFGLLSAGGLTVPRCEGFRYLSLPDIKPPKKSGFVIPDRDLILSWFKALVKSGYYYASQNKTWGVLQWLPLDDLKKMWKNLDDDDAMISILMAGLSEARALNAYSHKVVLLDPTTGETTDWASMSFDQVASVPEKGQALEEPEPELEAA